MHHGFFRGIRETTPGRTVTTSITGLAGGPVQMRMNVFSRGRVFIRQDDQMRIAHAVREQVQAIITKALRDAGFR